MKQTPNEYAEMLIDKYKSILLPEEADLEYYIAIQCAINDVNNTIEAFREINIMCTPYIFYKEALNILKSKL